MSFDGRNFSSAKITNEYRILVVELFWNLGLIPTTMHEIYDVLSNAYGV